MPRKPQSSKPKPARRRGQWSLAEQERLKRLYGFRSDQQIARELGRSVDSVRRMARKIFQGERRVGPWSAAEVQALKDYLGVASGEKIALILRRTPEEVSWKIRDLKEERRSGPWSTEDLQRLKRLYGTRSNEDLSVILGRPVTDIEAMAAELCLAKDKSFLRRHGEVPARMPRWSRNEVALLRRLYPTHSNLEIARQLNRTVKSVVSKAHDLGLRKSRQRLQRMGRENVRVRYQEQDEMGGSR